MSENNNSVATTGGAVAKPNKNPMVNFINDPGIQKLVHERIGQRAGQFTTSLLSLVNANAKIAECTPVTVLQAALTAASMDLPINQNLGFAYIVPYKNNKKVDGQWQTTMEAQFQMGWKGFVQLAMRSGKFKTLNTTDVREGEVKSRDRMTGELTFDWIDDDKARGSKKVVGYLAYFELLNGFSKSLYMTREEVEAHAGRYSQAYKGAQEKKSSFKTPWETDFDLMAQKTAIKLLLSKFAPLSTEMQEAVTNDQAVIREDGKIDYIDGETTDGVITELPQEAVDAIAEAKDDAELKGIVNDLTVAQRKLAVPLINERMTQLTTKDAAADKKKK